MKDYCERCQEDIDQINDERNRECIYSRFDEWKSDNLHDLKKEFYQEMLKNTPEGIKYDNLVVEEQEIDEYYPDELNDYCKEQWEIYNELIII